MTSISPNLNIMIKACEKASKILIRDFGELEKLQVSLKGPNNFVTNADRKVEKVIIEELDKSKKKYSILTEEAGFVERQNINNYWILDPIDGTTNFLNGVPHFCISLALLVDNEIISGVNNKSVRVSKNKDINSGLFVANYRKSLPEELIIRNTGSAALDLAYVSCGRFDASLQKNVNLWDIAAGVILVREAGGIIEDFQLKKFDKLSFKASNERINKDLNKKISMF